MTAGGSKSRYIEEGMDRLLEEDLNDLGDLSQGRTASEPINQRPLNPQAPQASSVYSENLRRDPIAFWTWHLKQDFQKNAALGVKENKKSSAKAIVDLTTLSYQAQQLNIQNFDELSTKIKRNLSALKKTLDKPATAKKTKNGDTLMHFEHFRLSVSQKLQRVEARREEINDLKARCKMLSMNPLANSLLIQVQETGTVILIHLAEQSDYLSKEEKGRLQRMVLEVMAEAGEMIEDSSTGNDIFNYVKQLDEALKEEIASSGKQDSGDLYYKLRKNAASRLRKALNYAYFDKQNKEVDNRLEECLKTTAGEFATLYNKFFDRKDNLLTQLSATEFVRFCKDFNREWTLWEKPHRRVMHSELAMQTTQAASGVVKGRNKKHLPLRSEPPLPRKLLPTDWHSKKK